MGLYQTFPPAFKGQFDKRLEEDHYYPTEEWLLQLSTLKFPSQQTPTN